MYESCAEKYKATPQQLELLRATLKERQIELFQRAVNATEKVHGKPGAYVSVIAALAEEGMRESLKKFLVVRNELLLISYKYIIIFKQNLPPVIKKETMQKRYDRWVEERKLEPLKTLANVLQKLPKEILDLAYIQLSIMRIYSKIFVVF